MVRVPSQLLYSIYTPDTSAVMQDCVHTGSCPQTCGRAQLGLGLHPEETRLLYKKTQLAVGPTCLPTDEHSLGWRLGGDGKATVSTLWQLEATEKEQCHVMRRIHLLFLLCLLHVVCLSIPCSFPTHQFLCLLISQEVFKVGNQRHGTTCKQ